jgi:hypothetical protein
MLPSFSTSRTQKPDLRIRTCGGRAHYRRLLRRIHLLTRHLPATRPNQKQPPDPLGNAGHVLQPEHVSLHRGLRQGHGNSRQEDTLCVRTPRRILLLVPRHRRPRPVNPASRASSLQATSSVQTGVAIGARKRDSAALGGTWD